MHEAGATAATHEEDAAECQSRQTQHAQGAGSSPHQLLPIDTVLHKHIDSIGALLFFILF